MKKWKPPCIIFSSFVFYLRSSRFRSISKNFPVTFKLDRLSSAIEDHRFFGLGNRQKTFRNENPTIPLTYRFFGAACIDRFDAFATNIPARGGPFLVFLQLIGLSMMSHNFYQSNHRSKLLAKKPTKKLKNVKFPIFFALGNYTTVWYLVAPFQ